MAYFDKKRNTRVRFSDLSSTYNVSVNSSIRAINQDLANLLGLYSIVQAPAPEHDPEWQFVEQDYSANPTYDEERMEVSWPWVIQDKWSPELDGDGNVVKTAEEVKAEFDAAQAEAEANQPTAEEVAAEQALISFSTLLESYKLLRNGELIRTDQYALPDWPHADDAARQAWIDYRQALREAFDGLSIDNGNEDSDIDTAWNTVIATAPDYVAPEAPAEEEEAAE